MIGQGQATNGKLHETVHYTVNANGDITAWVPDYTIPVPGVNYRDTYNWDWKAHQQPAAAEKLKEILGGH